jgi:hypothetical protein
MDLQVHTVKDYQHFVELTNEFDNFHGTKTYISFLTLAEISKTFTDDNSDMYLSRLINSLFADSNVVLSNEAWLNDSHIGKLNALSKIIDDIKTGVGITSPVSLSWFGKMNIAIHPGGTRLMVAELYNKPVPVVITDFVGKFKKKFPVECISPQDTEVAEVVGMNFAVDSTALSDSPGVYRRSAPANTFFKELTDHCPFYANPTKADPPVRYEITNDKLLIDGVCYACYNKEKWKLTL